MRKIVVSDTSCLIALSKIQHLELLYKLYEDVFTTSLVIQEFGEELPEWIKQIDPKDIQKQHLLELQIDKGEASAINLALEISAELVILDDFKARKVAQRLKLNITGTLGIIIKAKKTDLIKSIKPILKKLQDTNFRISDQLIHEALLQANETP